jgi:dTMP kinase
MSEKVRTGKFITLEGGEGAGKSTQSKLLKERLEALGIPVLLTREPGGSPGAEIMRHVILSGAAKSLGPDAEALLFAAARADHLGETILPALRKGVWVICDRFSDSTTVYQGVAGKADERFLAALEAVAVAGEGPDLTLVLDLPVEIGLQRAWARSGNSDRFESEGAAFHRKVHQGFRDLALRHPGRCVLIDAARSPEEVAQSVFDSVARVFHLASEVGHGA